MKSSNKLVNQIFRFMGEEKKDLITLFCDDMKNRSYNSYKIYDEILLSPISENYNSSNEALRIYSGYNFRNINNAKRGIWNYEENGHIDNMNEFLEIANTLTKSIDTNPTSIGDTLLYRGVNISYFKDYGISNIEELKKLEGDFLVDQSFVSTSLLEDRCFYQKPNELGIDYNVKIVYKVPKEFDDLAYVGDNAYNKEQCECLINSMNLAKVENVKIEDGSAIVSAILIPKRIYDDYYSLDRSEKSM